MSITHISWPHLPPVALKLRLARRILQHGVTQDDLLSDPGHQAALHKFDGLATVHAPNPGVRWSPTVPPDTAPLERYFDTVADAFRQQCLAAREPDAPLSGFETLLGDCCGATICQACASSVDGAKPCLWKLNTGAADMLLLDRGGHCLAPLKEIFEHCSAWAAAAYARVGSQARLSLRTEPLSTGNARLEVALDAKTREAVLTADRLAGIREITVCIEPAGFWFNDYLALAYFVMHECVAHGHCGVVLDDRHASRSVSFHDGWMDGVALKVLAARLAPGDGAGSSVVAQHGTEFLRAAERLHTRRSDSGGKTAPTSSIEWSMGVRALSLFAELFALMLADDSRSGQPPTPAQVDEQVVQASLVLNASKVPHARRRALVDALLAHFGSTHVARRRAAMTGPAGRHALDALREFLLDANAPKLIDALCAIPKT